MCSVPVTLGGGSWIENDGRAGSSVGWNAPCGRPDRAPAGFDGGGFEGLGEIGHGGDGWAVRIGSVRRGGESRC